MRILVACEFSGIVRQAFKAQGHDAWSCDLEDTEIPGQHIQDDVLKHLQGGWDQFSGEFLPWDLMVAHPPCTHLAVSGARWWKDKQKEQQEAIDFVMALLDAPIEKICLENPVSIISRYVKPTQYIQPYEYGHDEMKKTGLWLKNLPPLQGTSLVLPTNGRYSNQTPSGQNNLSESNKNRAKDRSRTYTGIAAAMAQQWTSTLSVPK